MNATAVNQPNLTLDLATPAFRADPYPTYAQLRRTSPLAPATVPVFGRVWLVTRYDDVVSVLKDPRFSSDTMKIGDGQPGRFSRLVPRTFRLLQDSMVLKDDPDHARLRTLVHQAFTPRRVETIAARVEQITNELLEDAGRKTTVDLLADFALPLPLTVISEMMGIPEKDRPGFRRSMAQFLEASSKGLLGLLAQLPNAFRLMHFFETQIRQRRADPQDDLLSALVAAEEAGDRLSEDELLSMIFLLLLAGHETTVNLIGNGMLALLENPDQLRRLQNDPSLIDRAVEELLRYSNPVEHGSLRCALEDVELHGVPLPKGSKVVALLASANRDEAVFENAEQLDVARQPNRHVAFGFGIHYCLGAPLARLEGQIALKRLVERYPNIRLAVPHAEVVWRSTLGVRGLKRLPVHLA